MKYTIYQISFPKTKEEENIYFKYAFRPLDSIDKVHFENYKNIYSGDIDIKDNVMVMLEKLFTIFNIDHPKDFRGHSLSVSDIVKMNNKYYYCDDFGWTEVKI